MVRVLSILVCALGLAPASTRAASVLTQVDYLPPANLVYQLDCLSGATMNCAPQAVRALWERSFLRSPQDADLVAQWGRVRARYQRASWSPDDEPRAVYAARERGVDLGRRFRIASLQAATIDDLVSRLELITTEADGQQLAATLRHFEPRFMEWWNTKALPEGVAFRAALQALLASPRIQTELAWFVAFYQAEIPAGKQLSFNLIYRPGSSSEPTSGEQIGAYSLIEFLSKEDPTQRIDVVLHELCHYLFSASADARFAEWAGRFRKEARADALPAYNLLNEALATALGNGRIGRLYSSPERWKRYLATDRSFYNDANIDRAGKALLPWLDEWLEAGKTMFDPQFVPEVLATLRVAFGDELTAPALQLNAMFLRLDAPFGHEFTGVVARAMHASSISSSSGDWTGQDLDELNQDPALSALFVVTPEGLGQMKAQGALTEGEFASFSQIDLARGLLWSKQRTPQAMLYVIVARSREVAERLVDDLAAMKRSFVGVAPE